MKNLLRLWIVVYKTLEKIFKGFLFLFISGYRTLGTTHLGGSCRFEPSCSEYAVEVLKTHNSFRALFFISKRLVKCRPGGPFGYDPVPSKGGAPHATR